MINKYTLQWVINSVDKTPSIQAFLVDKTPFT